MESLTLSCSVCFCDVTIDRGVATADPAMYVVPMFILEECTHAFCLNCCKGIQDGRRRAITCPTCRTISDKLYSYFYSSGGVVKFSVYINFTEKFNVPNDILRQIKTKYKYAVAAESSQSRDQPTEAPVRPAQPVNNPRRRRRSMEDLFRRLLGSNANNNQNSVAISGSLTVTPSSDAGTLASISGPLTFSSVAAEIAEPSTSAAEPSASSPGPSALSPAPSTSAAKPSTSTLFSGPSTSTLFSGPSTSTLFDGPSTSSGSNYDRDFEEQMNIAMTLSRMQHEHEKIKNEINNSLDAQLQIETNREVLKNLSELIRTRNEEIAKIKIDAENLTKKKNELIKDIQDIQLKLDKDRELRSRIADEKKIDSIKTRIVHDPEIIQMMCDVKKKIAKKKASLELSERQRLYGCMCGSYEHSYFCENEKNKESLEVTWLKKRKSSSPTPSSSSSSLSSTPKRSRL
ncbi:CG30 [Spodoptera litura nucleopolyhedrovirus II]|uniref:CG30 n=1 Tax=Spodoptera litura nucleopolyhedrovirus II TaxID=566270 RepID=UPI000187462C|nr:CG30 [Spodoptera litura nucleopolyhedrovirus II]ACI47449.1 CG30 [Spodoptera litura nucleopolyhedrovirus II]